MKKLFIIILLIGTIGTLGYGKMFYGTKIQEQVKAAIKEDTPSKESSSNLNESTSLLDETLLKNLSENSQKALLDNKEVKVTFLASEDHDQFYVENVKKELMGTYKSLMNINVVNAEGTTREVASSTQMATILEEKPFILVWEVPLLEDNGRLSSSRALAEIEKIVSLCKEKDISLVLQPTYPLYNAVNYPKQEEALKEFAQENKIDYIDVWSKWPENTSEEFLDLVEDNQPNSKGAQLWSQSIIDYFTGK